MVVGAVIALRCIAPRGLKGLRGLAMIEYGTRIHSGKRAVSPVVPFNQGYLARGIHRIHYEQCGNSEGVPVLFLHGGPVQALPRHIVACSTRTVSIVCCSTNAVVVSHNPMVKSPKTPPII